jgi:hypothetical protein
MECPLTTVGRSASSARPVIPALVIPPGCRHRPRRDHFHRDHRDHAPTLQALRRWGGRSQGAGGTSRSELAPNGACELWHTTGDPPGHATSNGKPRRYLTFPLDDFRHTTSASLSPGARNARRADRKPVSAPTASLDTSHRSHRRGSSPGHRKHSPDRGADRWRRDIRSWRR